MTQRDIWKHVQVNSDRVKNNRYLNPTTPPLPPEPSPPEPNHSDLQGQYVIIPRATTYAKGMDALRVECSKDSSSNHPKYTLQGGSSTIYRPLTFREDLQARVDDFNTLRDLAGNERTLDDRLKLFDTWLDSCTAVGYKKRSTKFKLVPESPHLIMIPEDFDGASVGVTYRKIQGVELDRNNRRFKYDTLLTQAEVNDHEAWINVVGDDADGRKLLREYAAIVFAQLQRKFTRDTGMGFYLLNNSDEDQIRALLVNSLDHLSFADGYFDLYDNGSFLRVAQPKTP
jgi:hypothetical protein